MQQEQEFPLTAEQETLLRTLKAEIRSKFLFQAAIILALTVCAVIAVQALTGEDAFSSEGTMIAVFAGLVMIVVNNVVFGKTETRFNERIRQMPELFPQGLDDAAIMLLQRQDEEYTAERRTMKRERNLILIVCTLLMFAFPPIFLFGIVLAAVNWNYKKNRLGERQITPCHTLEIYAEKWNSGLQWCGFLLWLLTMIAALVAAALLYTAGSHVESMNSRAKSVWQAAYAYQTDLEEQGRNYQLETEIIPRGAPIEEGTLPYGESRYYSDAAEMWYAVIYDEDGWAIGAYCSYSKLTPDELRPQILEEQRKIAGNIFRRDEVIGYYLNE